MVEAALSDVVVLELATGVAGPYCGKLLADLGAQVIKVEPPGGDPLRREPPHAGEDSVFFNWLNGNKLGADVALDDARLAVLAAHADIIIHDARAEEADRLDDRLQAANPAATIVSLTPYGRSGPRAEWQATPLTEWATSGYHYIAGDPAREPLALPGHQAELHAGLQAGIAVLAGLWHARTTGEGQRIEISHQEAVLSDHAWVTTTWTHTGKIQGRTGSLYAKCADGYIFLFPLVPYPNLFILMDRLDLLEDEELQQPFTWMARFGEVFAVFSEWAATRTKQEIYHACQELRIAASPINTMADLAGNAQLAAREWFETVEAGGERFRAPGFPYKLSGTPCTNRLLAPGAGEHTGAIFGAGFRWANADVARPARAAGGGHASSRGPLAGLRLIEVTANWAGPIGGRHLADLGAEVIKIELATKPATRTLVYINDDVTWPGHYNRSGYFNKLNRNKKAICLDLSKPAGRDVFLQLVGKADAVLENNAARVMSQLGVGYGELSKLYPGLVMCSMSGFASSGPERNYSAYGSNIETISGLASILGYSKDDCCGTGSFYADPVTGNHGAVALLAALHARRRTGRGQWADMALLEAVLPFFGQPFLEYSVTGEVPVARGNRWGQQTQGVYRAMGRDCWLALTVRDAADWRALCDVISQPALAALVTFEQRSERQAEVDAAIGAWAAGFDHNEAAARLQAAGVPAAPVMANWEIVSDNHLNDRDFFVRVRHEEAGTLPYPGFPWRFERTPAAVWRAAPMFAEHNTEVFRDLLGLSAPQVAALYQDGVTADEPIYAGAPGTL